MIVEELISKLQAMPKDAEVVFYGHNCFDDSPMLIDIAGVEKQDTREVVYKDYVEYEKDFVGFRSTRVDKTVIVLKQD